MSESHKEAIRRGVKKYHSECRKAMGKPSKKPAPKKKSPVKKSAPSKKPEIFFDTLPSPPKKKKLTEAEIKKLEKKNPRKPVKKKLINTQQQKRLKKVRKKKN